jgi:hypothetical protein
LSTVLLSLIFNKNTYYDSAGERDICDGMKMGDIPTSLILLLDEGS